jgi:glycosyltransferase involved in cell wall biosynthesis
MSFKADQITIAITVYDRREFIEQAIESSLNQTIPVKVMVVEDCGPDPELRVFVESKFGSRIKYVRNRERRGLFGNWNACIENCDTPWLSILHDDDYFKPAFVETMLKLYEAAPGRGLYFGNFETVDSTGRVTQAEHPATGAFWQDIEVRALADWNLLRFAGHVFPIEYARTVGGFRNTSLYCGDWEMWFQLVSRYGGVRTGTTVAAVRFYEDWKKGTSKVGRAGKIYLATNVQRKRNYACLRRSGQIADFDFRTVRGNVGMSLKDLFCYGGTFSRRILDYNIHLFLASRPRSFRQRALQAALRILGSRLVRLCSWLSRTCAGAG